MGDGAVHHDVDIKVLVPDLDYRTAEHVIRSAFPERGRPDTPTNPLVVDVKSGPVIVDFLLTLPGYEHDLVAHAVRCELEGLQLWLCTPEDLVVLKAIAGRVRDCMDIEGVMVEQHGHLDLD